MRRSETQISSRFKKKLTREEVRVFRWKRVRENNWKSLVKLETCYQFLGIRLKAFLSLPREGLRQIHYDVIPRPMFVSAITFKFQLAARKENSRKLEKAFSRRRRDE